MSAKLGAKFGLLLACLYLVYLMVQMAISIIIEDPGFSFLSGIIFLIITGFIFGVIPSMFIGIFTAVVISTILWFLRKKLSATLSVIVGLAVCIGFIVLGFYVSQSQGIDMATGRIGFTGIASHIWYKPIPLIVYTLAGGYMSWKYSTLLIRGTGDMNSRISNDKDKVVLP